MTTSEVAKHLLESADEERLELVELMQKPTDALLMIREKHAQGVRLSKNEWTCIAYYAHRGMEWFTGGHSNILPDSYIAVVKAFLAVYDILPDSDTRHQDYYLGNLADSEFTAKRPITSDVVLKAAAHCINKVETAKKPYRPLYVGRNLYHALDSEKITDTTALNEALAPFWKALWRLAARGHYRVCSLPLRAPKAAGGEHYEEESFLPPVSESVPDGDFSLSFSTLDNTDLSILFVFPGTRGAMYPLSRYAQLQEAGLRTARLDEIIRQKDPALKEVVEQLARGEVRDAIGNLNEQGRVHEIGDRQERIAEIAREYVRSPENTLVVSPDNESRREINQHIHRAMQDTGQVKGVEHRVHVLYARQDITGADRQHAQNYERGDVIRYAKGSKPLGIEAGEYARVARTEPESNIVTVTRKSGEELSYDPRRLQGVTVYRDTERMFAEGDRVQLTAPYHEQKLANRELGTVEQIDGGGNLKLKMDSGREVGFNARQHPHLDYGYAVTSHSSQGQTANRVLIHVDSEQAHGELLNNRMAYVSVSRAQYDAQVYTNDAATLGQELSRDVSKSVALEDVSIAKSLDPQPVQQIVEQIGLGLSL